MKIKRHIKPEFVIALRNADMSEDSLRKIVKSAVSVFSMYEAYHKNNILYEELAFLLWLKKQSDWWIVRFFQKGFLISNLENE